MYFTSWSKINKEKKDLNSGLVYPKAICVLCSSKMIPSCSVTMDWPAHLLLLSMTSLLCMLLEGRHCFIHMTNLSNRSTRLSSKSIEQKRQVKAKQGLALPQTSDRTAFLCLKESQNRWPQYSFLFSLTCLDPCACEHESRMHDIY